jgi:hypothetical protein
MELAQWTRLLNARPSPSHGSNHFSARRRMIRRGAPQAIKEILGSCADNNLCALFLLSAQLLNPNSFSSENKFVFPCSSVESNSAQPDFDKFVTAT